MKRGLKLIFQPNNFLIFQVLIIQGFVLVLNGIIHLPESLVQPKQHFHLPSSLPLQSPVLVSQRRSGTTWRQMFHLQLPQDPGYLGQGHLKIVLVTNKNANSIHCQRKLSHQKCQVIQQKNTNLLCTKQCILPNEHTSRDKCSWYLRKFQ